MNYWGKKDLLVSEVVNHTRAELSRLQIDESAQNELDTVSFEQYLEIRKFSFEKYKNFEEEFGGNLLTKTIGSENISKDESQEQGESKLEQGVLTVSLVKKIATMVINSISDDLTF